MHKSKLIQQLGSDKAINALIWIGVFGFVLYLFFMFFYPIISSGFSWPYVTSIWHSLQDAFVSMGMKERDFIGLKEFVQRRLGID
jgi:hypothetical protein